MNILKMKSIFKLFIALAVVGVLVTSCEKEAIQEDSIVLKTLDEGELTVQDTEQLQSRMGCSNFEAQVNTALIALAQEIENCAANPTRSNKDAIVRRYDYYRLQVLEVCLPQPVNVPNLTFDGSNCYEIGGGFCSDGSTAINALANLLCQLANFIENPNSYANQIDLENAFDHYVYILEFCFGVNITASLDI